MKKHTLYAKIKEDKTGFLWEKPYEIQNLPGKLTKYGRLKITFEKYVPLKSNKQMGYLHGGILPYLEKELYDDTGMSKKDWRKELKDRFGIEEMDKSGVFKKQKSLADYTEKEMSLFITQSINWVYDFFNMQVPPPTHIGDYI